MPGHLEKRHKGTWTIVIDLGRVGGKRKRIVRGFKGTKREAEQELARLLVEYEQGTYIQPTRITVAEYLQRWLEDYCAVNLRPKTLQGYRMYVERHLIPNPGPDRTRQAPSDAPPVLLLQGPAGRPA